MYEELRPTVYLGAGWAELKHLASRKFQLIDAFNDFVRPFEGERGCGQGRADRRMKRLKMRGKDSTTAGRG